MTTQPNLSAARGNRLGIGIFKLLLNCGGYRISLFLAKIVTWFYAQFDRTAFTVASEYLKLRFPEDANNRGKLKKHFHRQIYQLAKMLIVSYRMGEGKRPGIRSGGEAHPLDRGRLPEIRGKGDPPGRARRYRQALRHRLGP